MVVGKRWRDRSSGAGFSSRGWKKTGSGRAETKEKSPGDKKRSKNCLPLFNLSGVKLPLSGINACVSLRKSCLQVWQGNECNLPPFLSPSSQGQFERFPWNKIQKFIVLQEGGRERTRVGALRLDYLHTDLTRYELFYGIVKWLAIKSSLDKLSR